MCVQATKLLQAGGCTAVCMSSNQVEIAYQKLSALMSLSQIDGGTLLEKNAMCVCVCVRARKCACVPEAEHFDEYVTNWQMYVIRKNTCMCVCVCA